MSLSDPVRNLPAANSTRPRVCLVTAVPMTVIAFLNAHIERLTEDYDVFIVSNFSSGIPGNLCRAAVCIHVPIQREISLWADVIALARLWRVIRDGGFAIVQTVTPKAGLLGMTAAWFARVKGRVHWFTGQVWATRSGISRYALKSIDKIIARLASSLLADSHSQRQFLLDERVCRAGKIKVIAEGSICGVDVERFKPDMEQRAVIRTRYAIPANALLVLYLGRLTQDKGLSELAHAIPAVCMAIPRAHFMIVGPDEAGMEQLIRDKVRACAANVHFVGHTEHPERFMAAADVFCLPSYREGFGSVVIEAAAAGIPTVASRIYGLADAVVDGVTGLLVPPRDVSALQHALQRLLLDQGLRHEMGRMARQRAIHSFSRARIVEGLVVYYQSIRAHDETLL